MNLSSIKLSNFRNYKKREFEFSDKQSLASSAGKTTVIVGPNAIGKTNILEAISLLSTGKSFHARREEEMVSYDADIARVVADVGSKIYEVGEKTKNNNPTSYNLQPTTRLEVVLTRGMIDIGAERPERVPRKKLMVNGISRHMYTFAGNLKTVLFGPWDMDLVTESPSVRRRFLDNVLSQTDREYRRSILSYEKGIRQRNRLLFKIREEGFPRGSLMFWNQLLIKNGNYITDQRSKFVEFANNTNNPISTNKSIKNANFQLEYDSSSISESRLEQYRDEEVASATTLVGPHRDDFIFKITNDKQSLASSAGKKTNAKFNDRDLAKYGSRGEQRMGVLWLKLAELAFVEQETEEKPILLLDDIFSELDHTHRNIVLGVCKNQQTIITTADEHFVKDFKGSNIIKLI